MSSEPGESSPDSLRTVYCANCGRELVTDEPWVKGEGFVCSDDACSDQLKQDEFRERLHWMILGDIAGGD